MTCPRRNDEVSANRSERTSFGLSIAAVIAGFVGNVLLTLLKL